MRKKLLQTLSPSGLSCVNSIELAFNFPRAALRAEIGPDAAEAEGFGGSKSKAYNKVWPDLCRNPKGWG